MCSTKSEAASEYSKDASRRRRINTEMVQNVLLIWLDSNIDEDSNDCCNTIAQLRCVINNINKFTNSDQCIQFLETMDNEKACLIISGAIGQHIMHSVHDLSQVDSIFIFCGNKKRHEEWAKDWPKIKGVFTEITPICEALKQSAQQCEQNAISISFVATSGDESGKNLDQLDPSFMYTQIFKEILLTINFDEKHFNEFIQYCRDVFADNVNELKNIKKLEKHYSDKTPIWWYTFDCFLYPMLNRALRLLDVDIIIKMGFFIGDLHRHIEQLHEDQFGSQNSDQRFTVYRGQGMSKSEFDKMGQTKGGLISFNNFLSTSKSHTVSFNFANSATRNPDLVGVLFVITIDTSQSTTPFASVTDVSYFKDQEDEVLFSMHTVFRINDVKPMDENHRLFRVDLILTNDNDKDLLQLTDSIRGNTEGSTGWNQLAGLLLKMDQMDKAEEVYHILLGKTSEEIEKASIYHRIGWAKTCLKEYEEAITYYEKALEIRQRLLPSNHPHLAEPYGGIGLVYNATDEFTQALSYYEKALDILLQTLPPNHYDLAYSYNNIGTVYDNMREYSKALSYYEKTLEIQVQSLPSNHPHLGSTYDNIGMVYENMNDYSKAQSFYERAVKIAQQSLPSNHPSLEKWEKNLKDIQEKL